MKRNDKKVAATRSGDWIQTYTGKRFWPFDPRPEEIHILDIAHALSNLCRFGGHCEPFYSVGEHSVRGSYLVPDELALWMLLHDSAEAYLLDVPRPIKQFPPFLRVYGPAERAVMFQVARRFALVPLAPEPALVKWADGVMLRTEHRDLMKIMPYDWERIAAIEPLADRIIPVPATTAKEMFLARFNFLTRGKVDDGGTENSEK
jgi:hypothetical protein